MTKITAELEKRNITGRKVKSLRRQGIIPINIYGKKTKSLSAQISLQEFTKLFEKTGETNLVYVTVAAEKEERPCLISHIQPHPVTDTVLHADFHQVDLTEKVTAEIPVELAGEAPAVSLENATIVMLISEIEVEALPTDLPDKFTLDISLLAKVGDHLKVSDLKYNRNKIKIDLDLDTVIVSAQAQQAEEIVPEKPVETPEETEKTEIAAETLTETDKPENSNSKDSPAS